MSNEIYPTECPRCKRTTPFIVTNTTTEEVIGFKCNNCYYFDKIRYFEDNNLEEQDKQTTFNLQTN